MLSTKVQQQQQQQYIIYKCNISDVYAYLVSCQDISQNAIFMLLLKINADGSDV